MNISYPMKTRPLAGMTMVALLMCLTACTAVDEQAKQQAAIRKVRQETAMRMWKERCETKAGERIYKTVDNVDGIFLMKIRPKSSPDYGDQFRPDDLYGRDFEGDHYILNFLKGFYHQRTDQPFIDGAPAREGYKFAEAIDPKDGQRYRYKARVEEPWQTNKAFLKGYTRMVLDKEPAYGYLSRYGITFDDISTREEREYWIAGSSLRIVDLKTNEVIAERIGYMVDWAQGSRAGARSPWLFAADHACPGFQWNPNVPVRHASGEQSGQTLIFVEKVLKPSK